jgi:cysteate synthase
MNDSGGASLTGLARHYVLVCSSCGAEQEDDGLILDCRADHGPALLRTEYVERRFSPCPGREGVFRYQEWLPVIRTTGDTSRTAVYPSQRLAKELGLANLWIAFNGYWPERGAVFETATFKELEAHTVLGRLPEDPVMLTVASSGNTAAAFAWACSNARVSCLLIIPGKGLSRLRFRTRLNPCVNLVVIEDGDYPDAMELAAAISRLSPFQAEGGIKNVGRRDGLATVLLSAYEEIGELPAYYFQAIGSGTGAIAVLEAARRVCGSASAMTLPKLMLCQNVPFTPVHDAWRMNWRSLADGPAGHFREAVKQVHADELTNWAPPYEIHGGIYDALTETQGDVLTSDNNAVQAARTMFMELEGIDVEPAVGVALACLRDAVAQEKLDKERLVLLNVTGGGRLRLGKDYSLVPAEPRLRLSRKSLSQDGAVHRIAALLTQRPEL